MMSVVSSARHRQIAPARSCAYRVLRRVFERGAYADEALQAESGELDARDRALAMRLAYGAVQRRGTLDHLIERLAGRPVDAPGRAACSRRCGSACTSCCYLERLARLRGRRRRRRARQARRGAPATASSTPCCAAPRARAREALLGALGDDTPEQAAVKHSHPEWIARLWWEELGAEEARALMAADNEPGELALRANTLRTDAADARRGARRRARTATRRSPRRSCSRSRSTCTPRRCGRRARSTRSRAPRCSSRARSTRSPGERVLDLCAAPGGKSTHLAALMGGRGRGGGGRAQPRAARARSRAPPSACGASNVRVEVADAARAATGGAGVRPRARRPAVLGPRHAAGAPRPALARECRARSRRWPPRRRAILAAGAGALRPGGVLVYSTCTISPTENERLIAAFLDSHPDFALDDLAAELPGVRRTRDAADCRPGRC